MKKYAIIAAVSAATLFVINSVPQAKAFFKN